MLGILSTMATARTHHDQSKTKRMQPMNQLSRFAGLVALFCWMVMAMPLGFQHRLEMQAWEEAMGQCR